MSSVGSFFSYVNDARSHEPEVYKLLVSSHDDVEKRANVADAFFKEKDAFQTYFNSKLILSPNS